MEDFVSFDLAKKLKEKGFDGKVSAYYKDTNKIFNTGNASNLNILTGAHSAPTISQVLKWLREEKKIYVEPCILADADTDADGKVINEYTYWSFSVTHVETGDMIYFEYERIDDKRFDSYELAALAGIEYVLDNDVI